MSDAEKRAEKAVSDFERLLDKVGKSLEDVAKHAKKVIEAPGSAVNVLHELDSKGKLKKFEDGLDRFIKFLDQIQGLDLIKRADDALGKLEAAMHPLETAVRKMATKMMQDAAGGTITQLIEGYRKTAASSGRGK